MTSTTSKKEDLVIGDFFEDCTHHIVLCTEYPPSRYQEMVGGYSLFDCSRRVCSHLTCKAHKLTPPHVAFRLKERDLWADALRQAEKGSDAALRELLEKESKDFSSAPI